MKTNPDFTTGIPRTPVENYRGPHDRFLWSRIAPAITAVCAKIKVRAATLAQKQNSLLALAAIAGHRRCRLSGRCQATVFVLLSAATGTRFVSPNLGSSHLVWCGTKTRFAVIKPPAIDAKEFRFLMQHLFNLILSAVSRKIDKRLVGIGADFVAVNHQFCPLHGRLPLFRDVGFPRRRTMGFMQKTKIMRYVGGEARPHQFFSVRSFPAAGEKRLTTVPEVLTAATRAALG